MKQFLLITDTHLSDTNISLVTDIFKQAILLCKTKRIKVIFFLGDWFTSRKGQSLAILLATENIIRLLKEADIISIGFKGNHDAVQADSVESYLDIFSSREFIIYKEEMVIQYGNLNIHLLPYFKESGSYLERLNSLIKLKGDKNSKNILLTHIAVNGVSNNDHSKQENDIDVNLFKCYDSVFVGHFHNQSKLGNNIYYIGSAYQASFGEDDKKGVTILNDDGSHEFIQLNFPKYIKHTVDISDEKKIKKLQKEYAHSDDNIRIIFKGDETQLASLNKEKFNAIGIDVKFEKEVIRQDLSAVLDSNINFDRSNINQAFEQFCQLNDYQNKELGLKYVNKLQ